MVPTLQLSIRQRHCSRWGYADDLALLRSGDSLEDTTELLQGDLEQVIEWGQERCSLDRVASHLRHLANTVCGPPPDAVRKAVTTVVLPTALFGAEAWYCGQRAPRRNDRPGDKIARVGYLVKWI